MAGLTIAPGSLRIEQSDCDSSYIVIARDLPAGYHNNSSGDWAVAFVGNPEPWSSNERDSRHQEIDRTLAELFRLAPDLLAGLRAACKVMQDLKDAHIENLCLPVSSDEAFAALAEAERVGL